MKHCGTIVIPKTTTPKRIVENFTVLDFALTDEEYKQIDGIDRNIRYFEPTNFGLDFDMPYFS